MYTLSDILTARFYQWEARGRGWNTFRIPVDLEPEFYPFFGHYANAPRQIDDGRRPSLIGSLFGLIAGAKHEEPQPTYDNEIPDVKGYPYDNEEKLGVYKIVLPKSAKVDIEDVEHLFLMLSYTKQPISFEIVATSKEISLQFVFRQSDSAQVYSQIQAYFPDASITKSEGDLEILKDIPRTCVVDFGLSEEFMRPIRTADKIDRDPFVGLFASLEHLDRGERACIQVLFKGAINPWSESIMRSVTDNRGGSFFADSPEMLKYAQEKVSAPLFAVCIKVAGQAFVSSRAVEIAQGVSVALMRLTRSGSNSLCLMSQDVYTPDDIIDDMILRTTQRLGMILNSKELATLVHFPTSDVVSPKVARDMRKTKALPESTMGHKFVLGLNSYHGKEHLVSIPAELRLKHTHIIGATGTGKSTLVLSMALQDMELGNGLAVLDPHGDLIEALLARVPAHRTDDVILIDPSDGDFPVAFNILSAHSEIEKDILSSDLVAAFRRLSTSWGDQMNSVLANAILAFLESSEGGTLLDLRRFLLEKKFRDTFLTTVADSHVVYYWQHEYPLLKTNSIGSILTRLDTFLRPKLIRNMVAQKKGLDFESIMDSKKILLVKLSQGLIGTENSFLLGTFFVSKLYQAAMARQAKTVRNDFFLFIDEFQNFITPSMSHILSGARKYHLGLILVHQDMQQLQRYDTELASAVVVNAGTRICFRLGDVDAKRFASGFSYFEADDLENLHTGEAIARIEQPNFDFSLTTIPLPQLEKGVGETTAKAVIFKSRLKYGTPKEVVESALRQATIVTSEPIPQETEAAESSQPEPRPVEKVSQPFVPVEIPTKAVKKTESEHRYLQTLIKRMAESRGYIAIIEQSTPDGKGRVDVSLERNGKRIACEISVTTGDEWEAHNVEKCLAAGYDHVIVCSKDAKNLKRIRMQLKASYPKRSLQKCLCLTLMGSLNISTSRLLRRVVLRRL